MRNNPIYNDAILWREFIAAGLLVFSCWISIRRYSASFLWVFHREVNYNPTLVSGIVAALLMLYLIFGGYLISPNHDVKYVNWVKYLNWLLLFYMLAVFARIAIGETGVISTVRSYFNLIFIPPTVFVPLVIVALSLFKRGLTTLCAIACVLTFSFSNLLYAQKAMGDYGFWLAAAFSAALFILLDLEKLKSLVPKREPSMPGS